MHKWMNESYNFVLGCSEIVALLLENEASPNLVDNKGSTALHLAAWAGHSDIVRLILTTGNHVVQINLKVGLDNFCTLSDKHDLLPNFSGLHLVTAEYIASSIEYI